mmetsp:Transcript_16206/g.44622  ORF Transcript_16206/g.44622 Transcript_16206/m.44622 type:complete len:382 (-) Transcript_16206:1019-2164(-)
MEGCSPSAKPLRGVSEPPASSGSTGYRSQKPFQRTSAETMADSHCPSFPSVRVCGGGTTSPKDLSSLASSQRVQSMAASSLTRFGPKPEASLGPRSSSACRKASTARRAVAAAKGASASPAKNATEAVLAAASSAPRAAGSASASSSSASRRRPLARLATARSARASWAACSAARSAASCSSKAWAASSSCWRCSGVSSRRSAISPLVASGHSVCNRASNIRKEYSSTECFCLSSFKTVKFFMSVFSRRTRFKATRISFDLSFGFVAAQALFMRPFSWRITMAAESMTWVCSCMFRRSASSRAASAFALSRCSRRTSVRFRSACSMASVNSVRSRNTRGRSRLQRLRHLRLSTRSTFSRISLLFCSRRLNCSWMRSPNFLS